MVSSALKMRKTLVVLVLQKDILSLVMFVSFPHLHSFYPAHPLYLISTISLFVLDAYLLQPSFHYTHLH